MAEPEQPPLLFRVQARCGRARTGVLTLPHGEIKTPVFMPVGTQASIKGLLPSHFFLPDSVDPGSASADSAEEQGIRRLQRSRKALDCDISLGNNYHLGSRPGAEQIAEFGGLHRFQNWKSNLLTDSGGFQMVSLLDFSSINEHGVRFRNPHNGEEMMLTPEHSIRLQNMIGADIMMQLDDVVSSLSQDKARIEEAMYRSIRWLDRCMKAHSRPTEQALFGIIQGGLEPHLREICLREMTQRPLLGFAIGGLAGGEDKSCFWRVVEHCTYSPPPPVSTTVSAELVGSSDSSQVGAKRASSAVEEPEQLPPSKRPKYPSSSAPGRDSVKSDEVDATATLIPPFDKSESHVGLPEGKPRYLMGVGVPVDLVVCVALGVDMFDCVYASRCARFGQAFVDGTDDMLSLRRKQNRFDFGPVLKGCPCLCCTRYTRSAIHSMLQSKVSRGTQLLTIHNITYLFELMRSMRKTIEDQTFSAWVQQFMKNRFSASGYPRWVMEALAGVGIQLEPLLKPLLPDRNSQE